MDQEAETKSDKEISRKLRLYKLVLMDLLNLMTSEEKVIVVIL